MQPVQAILFDCDGVLVDSEVVGLDDVVRFLQGHGLPHDRDSFIRQFSGMRTDGFREDLHRELNLARTAPLSGEAFAAVFDEMVSIRRARRETMTVVPGTPEMLNELMAQRPDIVRAVASSSAAHFLDDKINRFNLRPFFDARVYSADAVERGKPAPDIFMHAADSVGIPAPACLVIEDSPHGVAAGIAAGAMVWGFCGGGHCLDGHEARLLSVGASRVFANHTDLAQAFIDLL